jgi:flagellar hook assembly protein FlgD
MPEEYSLSNNYPNPFKPTTRIDYSIKDPGGVQLTIYNITVSSRPSLWLRDSVCRTYSVHWDGRDDAGFSVPSGTYIYTLEANDFKQDAQDDVQ